jgi:hypothetical protein
MRQTCYVDGLEGKQLLLTQQVVLLLVHHSEPRDSTRDRKLQSVLLHCSKRALVRELSGYF